MGTSGQRTRFRLGPVRVNWQALMHARPRPAALSRTASRKLDAKAGADGQLFLPGLEHLCGKTPKKRRASKGVR